MADSLVGRRRKSSGLVGVLVVDKPRGVTSHDVVQRVRRELNEPRVGHAGTLDPMATGVLVVMVGEATKLAPFLTADDKSYRAEVQLGKSTDTLDAEGETRQQAPLPAWWTTEGADATIVEALVAERMRRTQSPPVYSAIKIDGRSAHARVRVAAHPAGGRASGRLGRASRTEALRSSASASFSLAALARSSAARYGTQSSAGSAAACSR